jgi:hypothetical protein
MPTVPLSPADSRSYLGLGVQSAKGTAVAPTHFATYVGQITHAHNPNLRDVREAGGGAVPARQVKDFLAPNGQFAAPQRPDFIAFLAALFLGGETGVTGVGPYVHEFTYSDVRQLMTVERNIADDVVERIVDAVVHQMTLNFQKRDSGPEVMATAVYEGRTPTNEGSTATSESYETDRPWLRSDCTWVIDTSLTPTNVESATIDLTKEYDATILADAVVRSDIVPLRLGVSVEVVQLFESADEAAAYRLTHYYDGTGTPAAAPGELVYPGDLAVTATYGAGAAARTLLVELPAVNWGEAVLTENDPEASEAVRITRRGIVVASAEEPVTITVTNDEDGDYL